MLHDSFHEPSGIWTSRPRAGHSAARRPAAPTSKVAKVMKDRAPGPREVAAAPGLKQAKGLGSQRQSLASGAHGRAWPRVGQGPRASGEGGSTLSPVKRLGVELLGRWQWLPSPPLLLLL